MEVVMETTGITNIPNAQADLQAFEQKQANPDVKRVEEQKSVVENKPELKAFSAAEIEEIEKSSENLDRLMEVYGLGISFDKDVDANRQVLKVYDRETQEVIKQYPNDGALAAIKHLNNYLESRTGEIKQELSGALFDEKI